MAQLSRKCSMTCFNANEGCNVRTSCAQAEGPTVPTERPSPDVADT